jgi:flagellar M-ring protein FliF
MPDRVKEILNKIIAWWKGFSTKQKTLTISITAVVLVALVILYAIMSKPNMVQLITCKDATQASSVKGLLDGDKLNYKISSDGMTFSVNASDEANAKILLGSKNIPSEGFGINDALDGGFSMTEADKTKKYQLYLEKKFADQLETIENVESASVSLSIPEKDGTLITKNEETYASVILKLKKEMSEDQAAGLAQYISTEVGNKDTDSVLIMDTGGSVLFSGADSKSTSGVSNTQLAYQTKAENKVKKAVKDVVLGTDVYKNVEVGLNLKLDFNNTKVTDSDVYVHNGQDQGYLKSESNYESNSKGGTSGTPGTDSNDGTTYVLPDSQGSTQTITDNTKEYNPSVKVTETQQAVGDIQYDKSSITVVATNYVTYNEDTLKADGTLKNMTFDQFVQKNSARVKTTVDQDYYNMVSKATGIAPENITIVAYDVPFFVYSSNSGRSWTDYLQIALAVLIFALLGYVVFRSTRKESDLQMEPELSVESLLETTKEAEQENLEDIGYNEKSETRLLIEKFVDENPEAVASLLRNWLNEEWN